MTPTEPAGRITITRREKPVEGFKYRVDISFSTKPDYSKVKQELVKTLAENVGVGAQVIWQHILFEDSDLEGMELWKVIEPVTDKITDIVLIATSNLYGYEWHRVRLFILSEEDIDADELKHELDKAVYNYFGDGAFKSGQVRFLEVTKISKFPKEGRLISKTTIPLTMKMITDAADRLEQKKKVTSTNALP